MNIEIDNKKHELVVDQEHFMRRLGFPSDYELPEHMEETMEMTTTWYEEHGQPWLGIYEIDVTIDGEEVRFDEELVESEKIYKRFVKYGVNKAVIILATAGLKSDERIKELWEDYPDQSFFLDAYAASVTESIVNFAVDYIKSWSTLKGQKSLSRYSPGYIGWNLTQQKVLMDAIMKKQDNIPVELTDSALLFPLKSQISVVGLHNKDVDQKKIEMVCSTCSFMKCSCREKHLIG